MRLFGGQLRGCPHADLIAHPGPGDWSIQELVIHLADSDAIAIDRMKRILTEDNPPLLNADETAYVHRLLPNEHRSTPLHSSTSAGGNGRVYSADYQTTRSTPVREPITGPALSPWAAWWRAIRDISKSISSSSEQIASDWESPSPKGISTETRQFVEPQRGDII